MMLSQSTDIHVSLCFTEAEVRALAKERQKKDNHNLSESIKIESNGKMATYSLRDQAFLQV